MKKYYRKFSVYSSKELVMEFQFFDNYAIKVRKDNNTETFLKVSRASAIIDILVMSDFPNITFENWEEPKEKNLLKKLKSGEKIII